MDIYQRIGANEEGLSRLFSKYRINTTGLDGIREGYARFGASFIGLVADVLNDHLSPFDSETDLIGPQPYDYDSLPGGTKKSIWDSLNSILDVVDRGGQVIWNIKNGQGSDSPPPPSTHDSSMTYLYIGAAIALVVILFLIFKK